MLATGGLAGIAAGAAGHRLLARWLSLTTGYPAPFALAPGQIVVLLGALLGIVLPLVGAAGVRAARADPVALER